MLSLGDGIAIASLLLVIFAVVVKWRTPVGTKYVTEKTCEATTDGMKIQLSDIKTDIEKLFDKLDSYGALSDKLDILISLSRVGKS